VIGLAAAGLAGEQSSDVADAVTNDTAPAAPELLAH